VVPGKPTVRKAQLPGGNRVTEKRMPVAERQQETGTRCWLLRWRFPHNWPDRAVARLERALTRVW